MPREILHEKKPRQVLQEGIFDAPQITSREAKKMKTYLKIPTEMKNLDPEWIKKAFAG